MTAAPDVQAGLDIDFSQYVARPDRPAPALLSPDEIDQTDAQVMANVGIALTGVPRAGTYIQRDYFPICLVAHVKNVELLPLATALARYDWLRERYYWQAVPADLDQYTAQCAADSTPQGFFIRVNAGVKVTFPVQACLYMTRDNMLQAVHNVVILDKGAELNLITGCTMHGSYAGAHLGITESYVGPAAKLTSTMIHSWSLQSVVRPRSGTVVEAGGSYVENYCTLQPAASIQTNPRTWLTGEDASAKHLTIILGSQHSLIDTGGEVYLNGKNSRAELAYRAVCTGGRIYQRGLLIGQSACRAHVDCAGMVVSPGQSGFIESTPALRALHPDARMSHEASIGKIAPEQVEYLQTRGLEEREAVSLIIRGFLGGDIAGIGSELDARIAEIAELAGHGEE